MLKISELKFGDIVKVDDEGVIREGEVQEISGEEKMALVDNGVQPFWYKQEDIYPVLLDAGHLRKLGFEKEVQEDGSIKYKKGAFRLKLKKEEDFSHIDMWYRDDRRHFSHPIAVHELQNLHAQMTKVPLNVEVFD